jgi:DNA-directed RNA polymerase subunit RPC12/RpoP
VELNRNCCNKSSNSFILERLKCESEVDSFVKLGKELEVEGLANNQKEEVQGDDDLATEEPIVPKLEVDSFLEERLDEEIDSEFSFEEIAVPETEIENSEKDAAPPKKKIKQEKYDAEQDIDKKQYSCLHCDFTSGHQVSLKKHRLSKHEAVRYQCERCERSYTDRSALLRHKKAVHDGFVYKCETCDKHFSDGGALTRHKKNIHSSIN